MGSDWLECFSRHGHGPIRETPRTQTRHTRLSAEHRPIWSSPHSLVTWPSSVVTGCVDVAVAGGTEHAAEVAARRCKPHADCYGVHARRSRKKGLPSGMQSRHWLASWSLKGSRSVILHDDVVYNSYRRDCHDKAVHERPLKRSVAEYVSQPNYLTVTSSTAYCCTMPSSTRRGYAGCCHYYYYHREYVKLRCVVKMLASSTSNDVRALTPTTYTHPFRPDISLRLYPQIRLWVSMERNMGEGVS